MLSRYLEIQRVRFSDRLETTVDVDEHCALIEATVKHVAKRIPVIAGTGANSTREAIELAAYAKQVGADMSLSVVPYYNKPTQEGLYLHFRAIAEAVVCGVPVVVARSPTRRDCWSGSVFGA